MQARLRSGVRRAQSLVRRTAVASAAQAGSFSPRLAFDKDAAALLLSPHWDDAVLSCWDLLTGGAQLEVVNVFAGLPQPGESGRWEALAGLADSRERAAARMAEDAQALAAAGRQPRNLPLLDAGYRRRPLELAVRALDEALAGELRLVSRVYAPAGIGGHADHVLVRSYARALLGAGIPVELYADVPYCAIHGWPSWVDGGEPEPGRDVDAYWRWFLTDVPEMPPLQSALVTRLPPDDAAAKLAAVSCYRMSLNLSVKHLLADPAYGAVEIRWQLEGAGR